MTTAGNGGRNSFYRRLPANLAELPQQLLVLSITLLMCLELGLSLLIFQASALALFTKSLVAPQKIEN